MSKFLGIFAIIIVIHCDNTGDNFLNLYVPEPDEGDDTVLPTTVPVRDALGYKSKSDWNPVYALSLNVFVQNTVPFDDISPSDSEFSTQKIIDFLTGTSAESINPVLFQAGIVVENITIKRVQVPNNFAWIDSDFIFNGGSCHAQMIDMATGATATGCGQAFRLGFYRNGFNGGVASVGLPPTHAMAAKWDVSRNVVAHEIGHILRLPHSNDIRFFPCEYGKTYERSMLNTIFPRSYRFIDCEIEVMRAYLQLQLRQGMSWVREIPSGTNPLPGVSQSNLATTLNHRNFSNDDIQLSEARIVGLANEVNYEKCNTK